MFGASSELASVMEFGFIGTAYLTTRQVVYDVLCVQVFHTDTSVL